VAVSGICPNPEGRAQWREKAEQARRDAMEADRDGDTYAAHQHYMGAADYYDRAGMDAESRPMAQRAGELGEAHFRGLVLLPRGRLRERPPARG
jgi:hypothetical protein